MKSWDCVGFNVIDTPEKAAQRDLAAMQDLLEICCLWNHIEGDLYGYIGKGPEYDKITGMWESGNLGKIRRIGWLPNRWFSKHGSGGLPNGGLSKHGTDNSGLDVKIKDIWECQYFTLRYCLFKKPQEKHISLGVGEDF